jgi:hypothetical protein
MNPFFFGNFLPPVMFAVLLTLRDFFLIPAESAVKMNKKKQQRNVFMTNKGE